MSSGTEPKTGRRASSTSPKKKKEPEGDVQDAEGGAAAAHPLLRDDAKGMNPTTLQTGFYGARGERIRHVVHEGALRLPQEALDILVPMSDGSQETSTANQEETFELPGLDSVHRPSRDPKLESITVTDVYNVVVQGQPLPTNPPTMSPPTLRTVAKNRLQAVPKPPPAADTAERIRGGGDGSTSEGQNPVPSSSEVSQGAALQQGQAQSQAQPVASGEAPAGTSTSSHPHQAPLSTSSSQAPAATAPARTSPMPTSSSNPVPVASAPSASAEEPNVLPLNKRPAPQWEQHLPGTNDDLQVDAANKTPKPDWYTSDGVSELEKTALPEWFDGSAPHRTAKSYVEAREKMIEMSDKLVNRYVTTTMVRRAIPGDVGSLTRLHKFLTNFSLINEDAQNDSAPTPVTMQEDKSKFRWAMSIRTNLLNAVVEQARKRPKLENPAEFVPIDWEAVADQVGHGVNAKECERQFLALPISEHANERSITPDMTSGEQDKSKNESTQKDRLELQQELLQSIIDKCDPSVVSEVTKAAFRVAGGDLESVQRAGVVGAVYGQALEEARFHEDSVAHLLSEIVDLRMQKLENRLSLLDDVEGMLEAERVALELERRDLYTARCRNWFGGP